MELDECHSLTRSWIFILILVQIWADAYATDQAKTRWYTNSEQIRLAPTASPHQTNFHEQKSTRIHKDTNGTRWMRLDLSASVWTCGQQNSPVKLALTYIRTWVSAVDTNGLFGGECCMFSEIRKFFYKMIEKRKHCHVFESNAIDGNGRIIM